MAYATGEVSISVAGSSFDSATYPRFVLGDGTNSLTFVIDNNARGLMDTAGNDAISGDYTSPTVTYPLEDSQKGRLVVPTFDEADGAKKALLSFWITNEGTWDDAWLGVDATDGGGISAIATRPHFILTDADGSVVKIGGGSASASNLSTDSYTLLAKYGSSGSPRFFIYKKDSAAEYFIRVVSTGSNDWKALMCLMAPIKHAYLNDLTNIDVKGVKLDGTLMTLSSVANDTYTASETQALHLEYETAGFKGNACSLEFKDPSAEFNTSNERKCSSWGYDEYLASDANIFYLARHSTAPTADQFWGDNLAKPIYFRQGTVAGSGSDASLTSANIAEAIKDMINGSILGITATRSSSTVSLTNDASGTSGNVTITTTNSSSLFTVSGMAISEEEETTDMRTTISAKQLALSSSGGIAAYTGSSAQPSLKMDISALAALGASPATGDYIALHDVTTANSVKKITVAELIGSVAAGSDTHVQFNDGGSSLGGDAGLVYNKTTDTLSIGNDLKLTSDSAVLSFGAGSDVSLTHTNDVGVHLNAGMRLGFRDQGGEYIYSVSDGTIGIVAATEIDLTATTIDINGAVAMDGALSGLTSINVAGTITGDTSLTLDSTTITTAEIGVLDGVTNGTSAASKAMVTDSSGDILMPDSDKFELGASSDMQLYHDGTDSFIDNKTGTLKVATLTSAVPITIGHTTSEVLVADNLTVAGNHTVTGNLIINGTTTTVNSTTMTVDDPIITLGGDSAPGSDDNKDRGVEFRYHDGSSARIGFMGWDDSATGFALLSAAANSSEVFSGTAAPLVMGGLSASTITASGIVKTDDTTDATSKTDGSLQTDGGLSVAKAIYSGTAATLAADSGVVTIGSTTAATFSAAGLLNVNNATDATSKTDGSLQTDGGLSVAKAIYSGTAATLAADSGVVTMGAATALTVSAAGLLNVNNATEATSGTDGSLQTDGGLSIVKSAYVGASLTVAGAGVTFSALADLTNSNVASGDKFVIQDADASGVAKEITFDHVAEKMAGAGIANTSGILSIVSVQDTYISGGGTAGFSGQKFTLTQSPASADALSVYVNGILQSRSGSSGGFQGERDYNVSGTALTLVSANALAAGDELVVKYIKD